MSETMPLPCPFCGSTNISSIEMGDTFRWRYACCADCGASAGEVRVQTMGKGTREQWEDKARDDAIVKWNARAPKAQGSKSDE